MKKNTKAKTGNIVLRSTLYMLTAFVLTLQLLQADTCEDTAATCKNECREQYPLDPLVKKGDPLNLRPGYLANCILLCDSGADYCRVTAKK